MATSAGCLPYIGFVGRPHPEDIHRTTSGRHPEDIRKTPEDLIRKTPGRHPEDLIRRTSGRHPEDIRKTSGRPPEITGEGENSSAKLIWGMYT